MPGLTRLEVLRTVRANPAISDLEVIQLTAYARDSDVDIGFADRRGLRQ